MNTVVKKILEKFPDADQLAFDWLFEDLQFFDTKTHKPLFEKKRIKAAFYLIRRSARREGFTISFNKDEEKLLSSGRLKF